MMEIRCKVFNLTYQFSWSQEKQLIYQSVFTVSAKFFYIKLKNKLVCHIKILHLRYSKVTANKMEVSQGRLCVTCVTQKII